MKSQSFELECQKCRNPVELPNIADLFYWNNRTGFQAHEIYCPKCDDPRKQWTGNYSTPKSTNNDPALIGWT